MLPFLPHNTIFTAQFHYMYNYNTFTFDINTCTIACEIKTSNTIVFDSQTLPGITSLWGVNACLPRYNTTGWGLYSNITNIC